MFVIPKLYSAVVAAAILTLGGGVALAQPHHEDHAPAKPTGSAPQGTPAANAIAGERVGDPYPLETCPITGKKLGQMGDPVVKVYAGQEVRFCCPKCPPKFEEDLAGNIAKADAKIIKDQGPLYPLKTSLVTGKTLPAHPYEFVYGNRLIRLGGESEKAEFLKEPKQHLAALDRAVIAAQGDSYPLKTCPVSGDEFGGDMGKPVDMVIGGRLIRLCCKDCKGDVMKDPAKFIAMVDGARKGDKPRADRDHPHGDK